MWKHNHEENSVCCAEDPKKSVKLGELTYVWSACSAWRRLRKQGLSDDEILTLFKEGADLLFNIPYDELLDRMDTMAWQMHEIGVPRAWAGLVQMEHDIKYGPSACSYILNRLLRDYSPKQIGDMFVSFFSETSEDANTTGD